MQHACLIMLPCSVFSLRSLRKAEAAHKADEEEDVEMKDLLRASGVQVLEAKVAELQVASGFRVK